MDNNTTIIRKSITKPVIHATPGTVLELFSDVKNSGKIFSAGFIKKTNNEYRVMNCRTSVKKNLTGTGLRFSPLRKHLLPVFDMQKQEYRFINLDSLLWIQFRSQVYVF